QQVPARGGGSMHASIAKMRPDIRAQILTGGQTCRPYPAPAVETPAFQLLRCFAVITAAAQAGRSDSRPIRRNAISTGTVTSGGIAANSATSTAHSGHFSLPHAYRLTAT